MVSFFKMSNLCLLFYCNFWRPFLKNVLKIKQKLFIETRELCGYCGNWRKGVRTRKSKGPLVCKQGEHRVFWSGEGSCWDERWKVTLCSSSAQRALGLPLLWDWDWVSELLTSVHREDRQHGRRGRDAVIAEFPGFSLPGRPVRWWVSEWASFFVQTGESIDDVTYREIPASSERPQ